SVLALGDHALERRVFDRVVLGLHGESALARVEAGTFRDGPAFQHPVVLEPKVIVEAPRPMLLDDELRAGRHGLPGIARGLRRALEIAPRAVLAKVGSHTVPLAASQCATMRVGAGRPTLDASCLPLSGPEPSPARPDRPTRRCS